MGTCSSRLRENSEHELATLLLRYLPIYEVMQVLLSFVPLNRTDRVPAMYVYPNVYECALLKPRPLFAPVVWHFYASQKNSLGVSLYVWYKRQYRHVLLCTPYQLMEKIWEKYFERFEHTHPICTVGFKHMFHRSHARLRALTETEVSTIQEHFPWWLRQIKKILRHDSPECWSTEGLAPMLGHLFSQMLRGNEFSATTKLCIKSFLETEPAMYLIWTTEWPQIAGRFDISFLPEKKPDASSA